MYGAILGDMIGAAHAFDRGGKTGDFPLFSTDSRFTGDSVMTVAVAEALLDALGQGDGAIRAALIASMRRWGRRYPNAGYEAGFTRWLRAGVPEPCGSAGSGSATRASPAGWLCETLPEARRVARLTAEVTHNHPEGVRGAEAVASAIFLARRGATKRGIMGYLAGALGYDLSRTCDEIRQGYRRAKSCQRTVPEAVAAFLEGESFEDVLRTAILLGGDCGALTCVAGSAAEAFYGVPAGLEAACGERLPGDMLRVLRRFERRLGRGATPEDG